MGELFLSDTPLHYLTSYYSLWLIFPGAILYHFGRSIANTLRLAAKVDKKKAQ